MRVFVRVCVRACASACVYVNLRTLKLRHLYYFINLRGGYMVVLWTFRRGDGGSKPPIAFSRHGQFRTSHISVVTQSRVGQPGRHIITGTGPRDMLVLNQSFRHIMLELKQTVSIVTGSEDLLMLKQTVSQDTLSLNLLKIKQTASPVTG